MAKRATNPYDEQARRTGEDFQAISGSTGAQLARMSLQLKDLAQVIEAIRDIQANTEAAVIGSAKNLELADQLLAQSTQAKTRVA